MKIFMHYSKYSTLLLFLMVCSSLYAQVRVRQEPHHKTVLQNDYVRLLDVHIRAGDTTLYHIHSAPSIMVHITKSIIGVQIKGHTIMPPSEVLEGKTSFAAYDKTPIIHRVYNAGKNIFHVMDIELVKKQPSVNPCAASQIPGAVITIDEKLARVYKFDLADQQLINLPAGRCAHLVICITGEITINGKTISAGKYLFFNSDSKASVTNKQNDNATCVVLELK
jgi:hypothetical protein